TMSVTEELFIRTHLRRREGSHFWEDTWNGSRNYGTYGPFGGVPEHLRDEGLYIPELQSYRDEVGGSSYVIAELDDSYTSYNEFSIEAEWKGERTYLNASYVWSHYYGNFDQDNVSGTNDANRFIGSSSLADGRGRQIWDGKEGKLYGDKPHVFKAFGYYTTDWEANIGAYLVYQSGDVWEAWDGSLYGYSSSTIRNAETAGSRRGPSHWQLDLNYTQDFELSEAYTLQLRADIYNIFDNQTGYNLDPYVSNESFGQPRSQYNPRRFQLSVNLVF
ncbi:MAG: carboxypeptidase regulatory-like domain-containing protein, partial [Kangiellaceae bacterium]